MSDRGQPLIATVRGRLFWIAAAVYIAGAAVWIASQSSSEWDYQDDAGPPIDALVHGRIGDFLSDRPLMGPLSLLLRAPFVALAHATAAHTGPEGFYYDDYRFGVFPCVVAAGILGLALARLMERRGSSVIARGMVVGLAVINPVSLRAVHYGHPEEILGAALLVGAGLAALARRPWLAAILLACAIANKQWAVIGAPAVIVIALLANDRRALRKPALAGLGLGAVLVLPLLIVDASSLWNLTRGLADLRNSPVWPASLWYGFMPPLTGDEARVFNEGLRHMPDWLGLIARPLLVALGVAVPLALARRVGADLQHRGLALLALVMLMRCALDPANNGYYHVPFLLSLLAADALRGRFYATAAACVFLQAPTTLEPSAEDLNAFYTVWAAPFLVYLAGRAWGIDWIAAFRARSGRAPAAARDAG